MPVGNKFFWCFSLLFGFDEDGGSKVVCGVNVNDVVSFQPKIADKNVGGKVGGGDMT
jgi:hypothetical protein